MCGFDSRHVVRCHIFLFKVLYTFIYNREHKVFFSTAISLVVLLCQLTSGPTPEAVLGLFGPQGPTPKAVLDPGPGPAQAGPGPAGGGALGPMVGCLQL